MKLAHLRYFEHLAEVLNYTKAAKELYIAQPTLSAAIKRMEQELGFTLFNRSDGVASSVSLTAQGQIFLQYVTEALRSYDEGLRLARKSKEEEDNTLSLGTLYSMKGTFWSQAVEVFLENCEVTPHVIMGQAYSSELATLVHERVVDVALCAMSKNAEGLDCVPVWSMPLVACVHKDHPLAQEESITLADLRGSRVLTYATSTAVSESLAPVLGEDDCGLELVRSFDDEIALASFVSNGPRYSALLVYSFLVDAFEDVVCLPLRDVPADFHRIYLMSRHEKHSLLVDGFLDFMKGYRFPQIFPPKAKASALKEAARASLQEG